MYPIALVVHSFVRWLVLVLVVIAFGRAVRGWMRGLAEADAADQRAGAMLVAAVDTQLLLGIVLYATSPTTHMAMQAFGAAMHIAEMRYWAVEHATIGVLAVAMVHVGRVASRRASGVARHRRAALWYGVALVLVLADALTPWLAHGRPLLRT